MKLNSKRKKVASILLMAIFLVIGTIVTISILMSAQISSYLTRKSTELLSKSLKATITAREIKGNIFTGLAFSVVKINFSSGDSFYATSVKAEYDLFSIIFRREKNVKGIKIIKPTIYLYPKPSPKPQTTKLNIPLTLPLLFVNRIEIQDGSVYYNEKPILENFSLIANLDLRPIAGHFAIEKASFSIPEKMLKIQNLQGAVDLSNNILSLRNISVKSSRSSINLDGKLDLEKNTLNLEIKNGQVDLGEFSKQIGRFQIKGAVTAELILNQWQSSRIKGNLNYRNYDVKIQNTAVPDGKGKFTFYDTMVKLNHISVSGSPSAINIDGNLFIKNYSYQGYFYKFYISNKEFRHAN
jgi:hypothetical protein